MRANHKLIFTKLFSIFLFIFCIFSGNARSAGILFSKAPAAMAAASSYGGQTSNVNPLSFIVTANTGLLENAAPGTQVVVQLDEKTSIVASLKKRRKTKSGLVWTGSVNPEYGSGRVFLYVQNGIMSGRVVLDGQTYEINSLGTGNLHKITDMSQFTPMKNHNDTLVPQIENQNVPLTSYDAPTGDAPTTIDLLLLYTDGMAEKFPGSALDTYLNSLVELANQAYADSNINLTLNVVGKIKVAYADGTGINTALDALTYASGVFSNVPALRNQYGADLVCLVRVFKETNSYCGLAWLLNSLNSSAAQGYGFSVVQTGAASNGYYCQNYTMAHEIGHNLGCAHDKDHASGPGIFSYSYGYDIPGTFATIMSYDSPTIGYFSNPDISYEGHAIGLADADNARTIRQTKIVVANFRQGSGGGGEAVTYCSSQGNSQKYEWIKQIDMADLSNASSASKYSDFTSKTVSLPTGQDASVALTPGFAGKAYNEAWRVWIDYNKDGDFSDPGELVFSGSGTSMVTGSFSVPASASGSTRMRVSMQYKAYPPYCGSFNYGEVEDYTVAFGPPPDPVPPVADFSADKTSVSAGGQVHFSDDSSNSPTSWSWTFEGGTPSSSNQQMPAVTYNTPGDYPVTLNVSNSAGSDSKTKTSYIHVSEAVTNYCSSQGNSQQYEWIKQVHVAGLSNSSGAAGYSDFTSKTVSLTPGQDASVALTPGFAGKAYNEAWRVWIDYNKDGDFSDPGELVFSGSGTSMATGSFSVPASASGSTRMRVSMQYKAYPPSCGSFNYGEVEDYAVEFSDGGDGGGGGTGSVNYCSSQGNSQKYEWIGQVHVGDLLNASSASKYSDFTSKTVSLTPGQDASVALTPGFAGKAYNEAWRVWIDYNKDGDFSDSGELVFSGSGTSMATGSFNVPASASGSARMRVSMQYKAYPPSCGSFNYGEVEDYTVEFATTY